MQRRLCWREEKHCAIFWMSWKRGLATHKSVTFTCICHDVTNTKELEHNCNCDSETTCCCNCTCAVHLVVHCDCNGPSSPVLMHGQHVVQTFSRDSSIHGTCTHLLLFRTKLIAVARSSAFASVASSSFVEYSRPWTAWRWCSALSGFGCCKQHLQQGRPHQHQSITPKHTQQTSTPAPEHTTTHF